MSYAPPGQPYDRINQLVRRCVDPRASQDARRRAAREVADLPSADLRALAESAAFRRVLDVLDEPYRVEQMISRAEPGGDPQRERLGVRGYGLGADLRVLLHGAFSGTWYRVAPEIEALRRMSDRALECAAAVEVDDGVPPVEIARGAAWTQLEPGAGLLAIRDTWPDRTTCLATYLDQSLVRGAARVSVPPPLAALIAHELASRPAATAWFDGVVSWMEAWVAAAPLDGPPRPEAESRLRRLCVLTRVGAALRAVTADVRAPRLLALTELVSAVTIIRAAGRADVLRAARRAGGDPVETGRAHADHDRRAELLAEHAISAVLRQPTASELGSLAGRERQALECVGETISADSSLAGGLLPREA